MVKDSFFKKLHESVRKNREIDISLKKEDIEKEVCEVEGLWHEFLRIDKKEYNHLFEKKPNNPHFIIDQIFVKVLETRQVQTLSID